MPGSFACRYNSGMATLNVELSEYVKSLAESRAAQGGYPTLGEYLSQLIREEADDDPPPCTVSSDEELEALALSRLDDTDSVEVTKDDFARMRAKFLASLDGK